MNVKQIHGPVLCPMCHAQLCCGKQVVGYAPTGEAVEMLVCPRHVLPDWLLAKDRNLERESARYAMMSARWSIYERQHLTVPSLRRETVRSPINFDPPTAAAPAGPPSRRGRLAVFFDRVFVLLTDLLLLVFNAGERPRKEGPVS